MARFIYSADFYCDIGEHVFRTEKYALLHERIVSTGLARPEEFLIPQSAAREDLLLVHTEQYLDDLFHYRHTIRTITSEMPISRQIIEAFALGAGGTILACRTAAQERTMTMNLAGGFHHAFADHAEGFCYINDVAVGMAKVRHEGLITRGMVVDCDLHQGNGTAHIFRADPNVFTFSIHQENLYPIKQRSDRDVGLPDGCGGRHYLDALRQNLPDILETHRPEFVLYVAGADPYSEDQLGSLMLSGAELRERDEIVIGACARRGIPLAAVLAGGYAPRVEETVSIHYGTACVLSDHS